MYSKLFAAAGIAGLIVLAPVSAVAQSTHQMKPGAPCCADHAMKPDMPCCADHAPKTEPVDNGQFLVFEDDPQLNPAPPVRQLTEVWFHRPVRVGRHILQGRYVIEHDNDRMARGEPCTHIYAYDNQRVPVVRFHCTHLERGRVGANTAVLATIADGSMQQLLEFQFAGESAAHGVPSER